MEKYLDAIQDEELESVRCLTAGMFWEDMNRSNDVLLCSPVDGLSAKFILNCIQNHACTPPSEDVWKEQPNPKYWVRRSQNQRSFHDTESLSTVFRASAGPRRERITINSRRRGFVTHGGHSKEKAIRSRSPPLLSKPMPLRAFVKGLLPRRRAGSQRCSGRRSDRSSRSIARRQRRY